MKLVSWNVNGLRACLKKGFEESFKEFDTDVLCLQETKMEQGQAEVPLEGYLEYWNSAVKKGYSGTAVFSRETPISVSYDIGIEEMDQEGRVITVEYPEFYLVNCYTPNSKRGLERLNYRMEWEDAMRAYLTKLDDSKPVVYCGDLNVAHQEIDIKNASSNHKSAGFTDEERQKMTELLDSGFCDTFRVLHPETKDAYSWWSYMGKARENNVGWRIDYFLVSQRLMPQITDASIYPNVFGSDHCPVSITIDTQAKQQY